MRIVKRILLGIVALIAIVLITALFVKRDYAVERAITLNKTNDQVFAYIKQLKNQDHYSTFTTKDPEMKKTFKGTDATVGFIYAWDGNSEAGEGEQEIKKIVEGERVEVELRFKRPMEGRADAYMTTEATGANTTKLKWGFKSSMPYPFNVMRIFMNIEDMMGKELETSLSNLKADIEK